MTTHAKFTFDTLNYVINEQKQDRITADALYEMVKANVDMNVASFRVELATWLNVGIIKGFKPVKGRYGGLYPDGKAEFFADLEAELIKSKEKPEKPAKSELPTLDPAPIEQFILEYLKTNTRITVGELLTLVDTTPLNEGQFRNQMSAWLNDGKTFPQFESHKGKTGGIYMKGAEVDKWIPNVDESEDGSEAEHSNGFAVQITSHLKIHQSDERNWVIQKLTGQTWVNKGYHPDIAGCLKSCVKHMINGEFGGANNLVQLKDLANVFREVETRIFTHLEKNVQAQAQVQ